MNKVIPLTVALGFSLISCQSGVDQGCICTTEFRTITVAIVDSLMVPIDSMSVQTVNKKTNEALQVNQELYSITGTYVVADDSHIKKLNPAPAFFIFKGQKGSLSFQSDFILNTDECGCHVHKLAGPDTIVARL